MPENPADQVQMHGDAIALARAYIDGDADAWNAVIALPVPYPPSALLRAAFAMLAPALAAPPSTTAHAYLDARANALGETLAVLRGSSNAERKARQDDDADGRGGGSDDDAARG